MRWVFWIAAGMIFYTYVGYVCWLRLRLLWRSRPVRRGAHTPSVSIAMVVRNEEDVLESKLQNLLALDYPPCQIIVVSDGSTDRTEEILGAHGHDSRLQILVKTISQGKASGLNDALKLADGEIPNYSYFDLHASYIWNKVTVRVGCNNILDKDPPTVSGKTGGNDVYYDNNTYASVYDLAGRFLFMNVTMDF